MNEPVSNPAFAYELLQRSASSLAGYAASELLERRADLAGTPGQGASAAWKSHISQRILELAAAIRLEQPALFAARVKWARKAFEARGLPADGVRASLEALRVVIDERLPRQARTHALDYLNRGLASLDTTDEDIADSGLDPARPHDRLALAYLQTALAGDVPGAIRNLLRAVDDGMTINDAYLQVLLPAEREVGRLWHAASVNVAEEHLVTFAIQRTMAVLAHRAARAPSNGKTVLVAAVANNAHDIGLRAAADLYELAGWRAIFLGADVPPGDLVSLLGFFEADLLLLGVTLAPQLPRAAETIALIRENCERPVCIIVGGAAFDDAADAWKSIGADGYAADLAFVETLGARLSGLHA